MFLTKNLLKNVLFEILNIFFVNLYVKLIGTNLSVFINDFFCV